MMTDGRKPLGAVWYIIRRMDEDPQFLPPTQVEYQQPYPTPPATPPQGKKSAVGLYVGLAAGGCFLFLVFVAALVGLVFWLTADPLRVVNQQLEAIRNGDVQKAYSYCSSGFKQATSYESFRDFVEGDEVMRSPREFASTNRNLEGNTATLDGTIVGTNGHKMPAKYTLVKEAGAWRIQYIKVDPEQASGAETPREPSPPVAREVEETPSPAPLRMQPPRMEEPSSELQLTELSIGKRSSDDVTHVSIEFQVTGFRTDKSRGTARVHLIQDLETYDPDGNIVPELSRNAIKELQEQGTAPDYTSASFSNSLKIPTGYAKGTYRVRLVVHDEIGGGLAETTGEFEIP
jgi:hypothetical protein